MSTSTFSPAVSTVMNLTTGDPCLSQDHQIFTLPSGASAHKWLCDSPRAILVLQHGFGEYAERYVWSHCELIPKLNARRFEVWALDLWGHGRSPGARGVVNVQQAVDDHLQIRYQAATRGLPVFLFGHSLGGLIAAASVLKGSSSGNDGVILSSPALPATMPALGEYAVGLLARLMPAVRIPRPKSPLEELCGDAEQLRLANEDKSMHKGQISFLVAATALREAKLIWTRLGQWTEPTLVVHGTSDSWTQFQQSEQLVKNIASTDKTLHLVEGGYHELLNDGDHEHTLQLILGWLESQVDLVSTSGKYVPR
ncbi:Alpha/Beta hydrolase protein [Dactylonectria macrodidyma]|uniref:Alpha/Beta hydrolase protein n=1 Tax=Dactylonectria macrodidyma TaxID=307937 RepID=A0A9P9JIZ3_9HYPO|nr:Alpha/Beta hydrolase protein [Dactylonectria macrodidyma]